MSEEILKNYSLSTLVLVVILILYTISEPLFHKYNFHYVHQTGICMMVGVLVTFLASIINPEVNKCIKLYLIFFYRQILLKT